MNVSGRLDRAQTLFQDGRIEPAATLLRRQLERATASHDEDAAEAADALVREMRTVLKTNHLHEELHTFDERLATATPKLSRGGRSGPTSRKELVAFRLLGAYCLLLLVAGLFAANWQPLWAYGFLLAVGGAVSWFLPAAGGALPIAVGGVMVAFCVRVLVEVGSEFDSEGAYVPAAVAGLLSAAIPISSGLTILISALARCRNRRRAC